jgi:hypothetical protein
MRVFVVGASGVYRRPSGDGWPSARNLQHAWLLAGPGSRSPGHEAIASLTQVGWTAVPAGAGPAGSGRRHRDGAGIRRRSFHPAWHLRVTAARRAVRSVLITRAHTESCLRSRSADYSDRKRGRAMTRLDVIDARCEALFASELQQSDVTTAEAVAEAIRSTDRRLGNAGCVSRMAEEFGDHPDAAAERMRWARHLAARTVASPQAWPRRGGMPARNVALLRLSCQAVARVRAGADGLWSERS